MRFLKIDASSRPIALVACAVALAAGVIGCGGGSSGGEPGVSSTPAPCPSIAVPAIVVTVVDAVTRAPVAGASGTGSFEGGPAQALVPVGEGLALTTLPQRGVYAVTVRAPGYRDRVLDGIVSTPDPVCPIQSVRVVAELLSTP